MMGVAKKYGLTVIEDATEALGTKYTEGEYAGKWPAPSAMSACTASTENQKSLPPAPAAW